MFDGSQVQWCPSLCSVMFYLHKFIVCNFSPYNSTAMLENVQQTGKLESRASERKKIINSIELNFTGLNVFALNELSNGIAIRTDALNLNSNGEKSKVSIEGLKLMHLNSMVQVSVF